MDVVRWDASALPLRYECLHPPLELSLYMAYGSTREGVVDLVVTDLPFGKQMGNAHLNARLYPRVMLQSHKVLVPPVKSKGISSAMQMQVDKILVL